MFFLLPSGLLNLWSQLFMSKGIWNSFEFLHDFYCHQIFVEFWLKKLTNLFWPKKSKGFIYVLSFAITLADLVKSTTHVQGNLKLFQIISGFQLLSNFCLILIGEVKEPILTKKIKRLHLCSFFCHQACWSCEIECSCQREFEILSDFFMISAAIKFLSNSDRRS